jgi:16S rRNA (adenine(1408)-N(1))-methyltransferase
VVGKGRTELMDTAELVARATQASHIVVDLGTGDAHLPYAFADQHPDWLVIGVDALDEPMGETAHKAARKPARGGRANLVLLRASVEQLPDALAGVADEVRVVLPWGALLEGIVLGRDDIVRGIVQPLNRRGRLVVVLNGEMWATAPARFEHLPLPTPEYVAETIAPAFARTGITLGAARWMTLEETADLHTTWARKLRHGRTHPRFLVFEGARPAPLATGANRAP